VNRTRRGVPRFLASSDSASFKLEIRPWGVKPRHLVGVSPFPLAG
jgi:hypothetical protein